MSRSILEKAGNLAVQRRFPELIALLEPQVPVYRESSRFYYLLGSACLRTGDSSGAYTYLRRAEQLDPANLDTKLALAALHLRRSETEKAVTLYLEVLDARPRDTIARRALAFIRRDGSTELIPSMMDSGKIARFYPTPHGVANTCLVVIAVSAVLVISAAYLFPWAWGIFEKKSAGAANRPEVASISLNENEKADPVATGGNYLFILTEKEAIASFERAKHYFQNYRDNAALIEINRLLGSNASSGIKEKARTLKSFAAPPDFRTLKDVPAFSDVTKDPRIYEGCAVAWKGRAANIEPTERGLTFDFLVGYDTKRKLEGIVYTRLVDSQIAVPFEKAFEILAIIRIADSENKNAAFSLEGLSIHEMLDN